MENTQPRSTLVIFTSILHFGKQNHSKEHTSEWQKPRLCLIWPQTAHISTGLFPYFTWELQESNSNFGPVSLYCEIKEELPWLLVTTESFKFCFCYTGQLLCEPHKLYTHKKRNITSFLLREFTQGLHPKQVQLLNSTAGCCITPVRRQMGGWQDSGFICLSPFVFLIFWVYIGGVKPKLKGQVSPASSKRKTSSASI